jgi:hypothetical protein
VAEEIEGHKLRIYGIRAWRRKAKWVRLLRLIATAEMKKREKKSGRKA